MADTPSTFDNVKDAAGSRFERWRLFLSEVRNELKRVTWPSQKEAYATTVVVILTSVFFGVYLFALDFGLLKLVQLIFRLFGVAVAPASRPCAARKQTLPPPPPRSLQQAHRRRAR